jgi:hypothetical protein
MDGRTGGSDPLNIVFKNLGSHPCIMTTSMVPHSPHIVSMGVCISRSISICAGRGLTDGRMSKGGYAFVPKKTEKNEENSSKTIIRSSSLNTAKV